MAALTFRLTAAEQALLRAYGVHQRDIDHTSIPELLDRVLEVATGNAAALGLYKAMGFQEVGRRKGYYERPGAEAEDALTLALNL
mgnify:CR=1 FL=1